MADLFQLEGNLLRIFYIYRQLAGVNQNGVESLLVQVGLWEKYPAENLNVFLKNKLVANLLKLNILMIFTTVMIFEIIIIQTSSLQIIYLNVQQQSKYSALAISIMNHGQRIFPQNRQEQIIGRNANIQPMMLKRKEIFEKPPTQRNQTPFSGYSFSSSSISDVHSLAQSQVNELSQDGIRKMIRQQLQKTGANTLSENSQQSSHKYKTQLNVFKVQLRAVKQSLYQMNKSIKLKFEENGNHMKQIHTQHLKAQIQAKQALKNQIYQQVSKMMKQYQKQTALNLRKVVTKMHEDVRKQFVNYIGRQFIPLSFIDDLDKQLNDIQDRIGTVQQKIDKKNGSKTQQNLENSKIQKDQSFLNSASELKLNKFQRQLQYVKKVIEQKSQKIKQMDELIVMGHQNKSRQIRDSKQKIEELISMIKDSQALTKIFKEELQTKIQKNKVQILKRVNENLPSFNLKSQNPSNPFKKDTIQSSFNSVQQDTSIILQNGSGLMDGSSVQLYQERKQNTEQRQSPKKQTSNKKITITYNNSLSLPIDKQTVTTSLQSNSNIKGQGQKQKLKEEQKLPASTQKILSPSLIQDKKPQQEPALSLKKIYKIDIDGYLMDNQNRYILTPNNSMIRVSQDQIKSMKETSIVLVQQWQNKKLNY